MFNAPKVITDIPDIAKIYEINDRQGRELDDALKAMDQNIFIDTMDEGMVERWEKILKISPADDESLDDRRFRIKIKELERLPYSYRVIIEKLNALCPQGYDIDLSEDRTYMGIRLSEKTSSIIRDVIELMERMLPLNMYYSVIWYSKQQASNTYYAMTGIRQQRHISIANKEVVDRRTHAYVYAQSIFSAKCSIKIKKGEEA